MGLLKGISAALSKLRQSTEPKGVGRSNQKRHSPFRIEQLEPRLLLSADLIPQEDVAASAESFDSGAIVLFQEPSTPESVTIDISQWDVQTAETQNPTPDVSEHQPWSLDTRNLTPETAESESVTNLGFTSFAESSSVVDQLIETLRVANAPPAISEMRLIDDDLSHLNGQIFLLDFDGASGVTYDGPVRVEAVEVRPFQIPANFSADKVQFISGILDSLNERFAALGVTFTTTVPVSSFLAPNGGEDKGEGIPCSTIFIGDDDSAFSQYGSFFGLAEQVDIGNQDRSDIAIVFSEKIFQPGMSAADYALALIEVIEHEALHLVGYAHADGQTEGLSSVAETQPPPPPGATITVNSAHDSNDRDEALTLREAILVSNRTLAVSSLTDEEKAQINGTPDVNTRDIINFNIIQDDAPTIVVGDGGLPFVTDPVVINGTTQPGFNPDTNMPIVEINASGAGSNQLGFFAAGLEITAGQSEVKGLVIAGAPGEGIRLRIGGGNTIIGNLIGSFKGIDLTDTSGNFGNRNSGILIDSANNQIGGATAAERNVISGNGTEGVVLSGGTSTGNRVQGNFIGTDIGGTKPLSNGTHGVIITAPVGRNDFPSENFIGGSEPDTGNVISGNKFAGVLILRGARNHVLGNRIGISENGIDVLGNGLDGVLVEDAPDTQIGGLKLDESNVISANRHGIAIVGSEAIGTVVQQNFIGTDVTGELDRGNREDGIFIGLVDSLSGYIGLNPVSRPVVGAPSNTTIGGTSTAARNIISGNDGDGVHIEAGATRIVIEGNVIGLTINGDKALGNTGDGVAILNSPNQRIGGEVDNNQGIIPRNVISGNGGAGVRITGAGSTTVQGNYIGADKDGAIIVGSDGLPLGNRNAGVVLDDAGAKNFPGGLTQSGNLIGGLNAGVDLGLDLSNVISGNTGSGVFIVGSSTQNSIKGNYIGTDRLGSVALPNGAGGVLIKTKEEAGVLLIPSENEIGSNSKFARNIISGNTGDGVQIAFAVRNKVLGNFIGTKANGIEPLPNTGNGVSLLSSSDNDIGAPTPVGPSFAVSPGNVISGNLRVGILIDGVGADNNRVKGNKIGIGSDGVTDVGNGEIGIFITRGHNNVIGGNENIAGNIIAFNGSTLKQKGHGVVVASGTGNRISRNSIFKNAGRGIDLGNDSFTLNDPGDSDIGANGLQDFPYVLAVAFNGGQKTIHWNLDSTPNSEFTIEFYSNSAPDPSGFGEGETFLGGNTVFTDATGTAAFSKSFSSSDTFISATATDAFGNTSEFSMIDTDGDALADAWEDVTFTPVKIDLNHDGNFSGTIDFDEDGFPDLELPGGRADQKDIYIEIDAMDGIILSLGRLLEFLNAFISAPAALVNNPNSANGILPHIEISDRNLPFIPVPFPLELYDIYKSNFFGTAADRAARSITYRYVLFVANLGSAAGVTILDNFNSVDGFSIEGNFWPKADDEAATFMHELGHSLGLDHGGPFGEVSSDINFKPNYHSIMNYLVGHEFPWMKEEQNSNGFQDPWERDRNGNGWNFLDTTYVFNYSVTAFFTLNENDLNEPLGIGGDLGHWMLYKRAFFDPDSKSDFILTVPELGAVDWSLNDANGDGNPANDIGVVADINTRGGENESSPGELLVGAEDWSHLKFYFLESPLFRKRFDQAKPHPEMSFDLFEELSAIGDGPGFFRFRGASEFVGESDGSLTITVTRAAGTHGTVSVDFATADGTARAGLDYVATSGTLVFAEGEFRKTFTIPILDNFVADGTKTILLRLSNPTGESIVNDEDSAAEANIIDDDGLQFDVFFKEVDEAAGSAIITLTRKDTQGSVSVNFTTEDSSATSGEDYTAVSNTLTFAPGQSSKDVTIPILDDFISEGDESLVLRLSDPSGGAILGTLSVSVLSIKDNDAPGVLRFKQETFEIQENSGAATIEVFYSGGEPTTAFVDFATADGTAKAGVEYAASAGTLQFATGEFSKTFTVPIIDDKLGDGTKTLQLILHDLSEGAQLGTPSTATLRIIDDETVNAATFVVTNTNDSGAGSLRQAILNANARAGTDFITFNIPGAGVKTIRPLTPLPTITSPVTIDGYSQPGSSVNTLSFGDNAVLLIELDGSASSAEGVLSIQAGNSIVRGLVINRISSAGVLMNFGGGNLITGNFIGTNATGTIDLGNGEGIKIGSTEITGRFSSNNVIGGVTPELRNVISGNDTGIGIFSKAPTAQSRGNLILGNYIGVAADGVSPLGNRGEIRIDTQDSGENGLSGNTIGGIEPGAGNIIAFNSEGGVIVTSGYGNSIRGNSIYANDPPAGQNVANFRSLGISLGDANGVSPLALNDIGDADTGDRVVRLSDGQSIVIPGGNRVQNFPMQSSATVANGAITIQGRLDSAPTTPFQIDFYGNEQMDPTGFGEGKFYLGTVSATTDSTGHVEFTAAFNLSIPNIRFITATATDSDNNTSEFSARVTVGEVLGSVFVVNTTDDHDDGLADQQDTTLREAIHAANNHPGKDTIMFNIPGSGVRTMTFVNDLPPIMDPVTIDGYTQPGAKPNSLAVGFDGVLLIQIAQRGLVISGGNSTVRGLIINKAGLSVVGAGNNVIEGNMVGLDATGNTNVGGSIAVANSSNNLIGGGVPAARNLLTSVRLNAGANSNRVQGNYIGTRANGLSRSAGTGSDSNIFIIDRSSNNLIGGTAVGERNVLLGGLAISGGPFIEGARDLGIFTTARGNRVLGNFIGVGADSVTPLGFIGAGVTLSSDVKGTIIGGIEPGAGNIIARNGFGVLLTSGGDPRTNLPVHPESNSIRGNSIFLNGGLAIDLDGDIYRSFLDRGRDVTRNDNTDLAVGPNHLQNFPVLSSALSANGSVTIQGRLNSTPDRTFQIDFYANEQMDPSGYGEGQTYIGTKAVTTDATGRVNFTATLPVAVPNGRFITATATNSTSDTSEFSARIEVGDVLGSIFIVNTTNDNDDGIADAQHTSLREAIHAANNHPGHDIITFNIPGGGVKTIATLAPLPPITDEVTIDGYTQPGASSNTLVEGDNAVLLVQILDGNPQGFSGAHIGLDVRAGNTMIRGLAINRFLSGAMFIAENGGNVIEGNFLGTDPMGAVVLGAGSIEIFASSNNLIGGTTPAARNLISGAGGIQIHGGEGPAIIPNAADFYLASGNVVQGNYIGTDKDGTNALGSNGVSINGASNNVIGGTTAGSRNVIVGGVFLGPAVIGGLALVGFQVGSPDPSANNVLQGNFIGTDRTGKVALGGSGVSVSGVGNIVGGSALGAGNLISGRSGIGAPGIGIEGVGHTIQGNRIGTDADGVFSVANRGDGIVISGSGHLIGGTQPGAGNVISGNTGNGIQFVDSLFLGIHHAATGNRIEGNLIGTQADGISPLPNLGDGILVTPATNLVGNNLVIVAPGATDNTIGGTESGAGNIIAFNGGNGVNLNGGTGTAGTRIAILGNSIYSNGKLGIDLKGNGPTANDTGDGDVGDNNLQNFPVLTSVTNNGNSITISGTLNSAPNATYRLEFFDNIAFDNSGFGEGARFIGAANVTTNASGNVSFTVTFEVAVRLTHVITSTATDAQGNTSEFSGRPPNGSFGETANLSVTKIDAPDPIFAGQVLTYTIAITNNGPDVATNIVLFDTLSNGVTFQPGTPGVLGLAGSNTVLATIASLASGASASVQIRVVPTSTEVLTNSVKVASDQFDPDPVNNSASATTTVNPAADLSLTMSSSVTGPVGVGSQVRFDITVTNRGPSTASAVRLTDTLPEALTFAFFSGPAGSHSAGTITWELGTLFSGQTTTRTFFATANATGTVTNSVQVTSSVTDIDTTNNAASVEIIIVPSADVVLTSVAAAVVVAGDVVTYTLTLVNEGPSVAEGVVLTDTLPANASFYSATTTQGDIDVSNGIVTFDIGDLPSGAEVTAEIFVTTLSAGGALANSGVLTAATLDPDLTNNSASAFTAVLPEGGTAALFGAAQIDGGPTVLHAIDTITGAASAIGSVGFDRISAMDFNPLTGVLYAVGQRPGTSTRVLITIDPLTGIGTEVGPTNSNAQFTDVSFRGDAALFGYVSFEELMTLDLATGVATKVGNASVPGGNGNGLAFAPDGVLYHADDEDLNSLNPATGSATALHNLSFSPPADDFPRFNAMDFDPDTGLLFGSLNDGFGNANENYLAVIDIATGKTAIIGRTVDGLDAIAFLLVAEPVNQPPELAAIGDQTVDEAAAKDVNISANDPDGDALAFIASGLPTFATFIDHGNGTATLTLKPGFNDAVVFAGVKIVVSDGTDSDEDIFAITVVNVNRAPVAQSDSFSTNEDHSLVVAPLGVLANDSDADGDPTSTLLLSGPSRGQLAFNSNGGFTYSPNLNFSGTDSFSYKANDGQADSNVATVSITINSINDAPVAVDDAATTNEDSPKVIHVLTNDQDTDSDALVVNAFTQPTNGFVVSSGNGDGSLTYTPNTNFFGVDTFTYTIGDGNGGSSTATVTVNVLSVNDTPVMGAMSGTAVIDEGQAVDLRGDFSDVDQSDTFMLTIDWGDGVVEKIDLKRASNFTLSHRYLDDDPTGTSSDDYQVKVSVTDDNDGSAESAFTVTVNNVAPVVNLSGSTSGVRGQTLSFNGNYTDPGILDTHQVAWDFGDGTVVDYQPANAETLNVSHIYSDTGTYSVKLTVRDDDGGTTTVTKLVTINAVDLQTDPCDLSKSALVVGGTNGDDKIRFVPQGNKGEIKVLIDGVSQGIFKPTGHIIAYGLAGNDDIEVAGSINLAALLKGDTGNDRLKGGVGPSVLCGGDGDDLLIGGSGRSILIGDRGSDRLVGNGGDDILIGGYTSYGCDHEAFCEILETWTRPDLSYAQRINQLGTGPFALNRMTVFDDGDNDQLTGAAGDDWFFAGVKDKITDRKTSETILSI